MTPGTDFPIPMRISTPRLILDCPPVSCAQELVEAIEETWDSLAQYGFMKDHAETTRLNYQLTVIKEAERQFAARECFTLIGRLRRTQELALVTGLSNIDWSIGKFTVHYWVRQKFQGRGLATECVHALLIYARDALGAKSVGLGYADGNVASRRVTEKLGFEWLRTDRDGVTLPDGKTFDAQVHVRWNLEAVPPIPVSWT